MVHRACHICSTEPLLSDELEKLKSDFCKSGYKRQFIDFHINNAYNKFTKLQYKLLPCVSGPQTDPDSLKSDNPVNTTNPKYIGLPYIRHADKSMKKSLINANIR